VTTPVFRSQSLTSLIFSKLLAINFAFSVTEVDTALNNVSLPFHELVLSNLEPLSDCTTISHQILKLLDFEDDCDMQLIQLGHLLFLEVLDLLLSLGQLLVNRALLALHALFLILQVANIELDALFLVIKVET